MGAATRLKIAAALGAVFLAAGVVAASGGAFAAAEGETPRKIVYKTQPPAPRVQNQGEADAKTHNRFGAKHGERKDWLPAGVKPADKADVLYFPGCASSYRHKEIARSTAKILGSAKTPFTMMADEWCCGNVLYSVLANLILTY